MSMEFLLRYAMQLMGVLVVVLAIIGGYYYWKHEQVQAGYDQCLAEVTKRDDYTMKQSERIRLEAQEQITQERLKHEDAYNNAIRTYADYADRMRVQPKAAGTGSNKVRVPTKASCPEGVDRSSAEIISELKEFNKSVKACELLIEEFIIPNMEVR